MSGDPVQPLKFCDSVIWVFVSYFSSNHCNYINGTTSYMILCLSHPIPSALIGTPDTRQEYNLVIVAFSDTCRECYIAHSTVLIIL